MLRPAALGVMVFACTACEHLSPRVADTRVEVLKSWDEENTRLVYGPRTLELSPWERGRKVTATVKRATRCVSSTRLWQQTREVTDARPNWPVAGSWYGVGGIGLGLGIYFSATAGHRPKLFNQYSRGELSKEGSWFMGAAGLLGGLAAAGWATWAVLTEGENRSDPEDVVENTYESEWDCGLRPESGVAVSLTTWKGEQRAVTTDDNGVAHFSPDLELFTRPPEGAAWGEFSVPHATPIALTPPDEVFTAQGRAAAAEAEADTDADADADVEPEEKAPAEGGKLVAVPAGSGLAKGIGNVQPPPAGLRAIIEGRVLDHFGLRDEYPSDADQRRFRKSKEFRAKKKELDQLRKRTQSTSYYLSLDAKVDRFNIGKRTLEIELGTNWGPSAESARPFSSQGDILLKNLPARRIPRGDGPQKGPSGPWRGPYQERLLVEMDVAKAMPITKNKDDVVVFVVFEPKRAEKVRFPFFSTNAKRGLVVERSLVSSQVEKLVIANEKTGEVYFEKSF